MRVTSSHFLRSVAVVLMMTALSGCASAPTDPAAAREFARTNDPLEPMNRTIFDVNDFLDRILFKPIAQAYRYVFPEFVRNRVAGIVSNMEEPVIFANNLMQGEVTNGATTAGRFLVNTVGGVGGMFDVAEEVGLDRQSGDFGQTLNSWGVGEGPYLVLPLFGPSNFRDTVGKVADMMMSPWGYLIDGLGASHKTENRFAWSSMGANGVVRRERNLEALDSLKEGSLDFYAQMRSIYRQYRNKELGIAAPASATTGDWDSIDYEPMSTGTMDK